MKCLIRTKYNNPLRRAGVWDNGDNNPSRQEWHKNPRRRLGVIGEAARRRMLHAGGGKWAVLHFYEFSLRAPSWDAFRGRLVNYRRANLFPTWWDCLLTPSGLSSCCAEVWFSTLLEENKADCFGFIGLFADADCSGAMCKCGRGYHVPHVPAGMKAEKMKVVQIFV